MKLVEHSHLTPEDWARIDSSDRKNCEIIAKEFNQDVHIHEDGSISNAFLQQFIEQVASLVYDALHSDNACMPIDFLCVVVETMADMGGEGNYIKPKFEVTPENVYKVFEASSRYAFDLLKKAHELGFADYSDSILPD